MGCGTCQGECRSSEAPTHPILQFGPQFGAAIYLLDQHTTSQLEQALGKLRQAPLLPMCADIPLLQSPGKPAHQDGLGSWKRVGERLVLAKTQPPDQICSGAASPGGTATTILHPNIPGAHAPNPPSQTPSKDGRDRLGRAQDIRVQGAAGGREPIPGGREVTGSMTSNY